MIQLSPSRPLERQIACLQPALPVEPLLEALLELLRRLSKEPHGLLSL